MGRVFVLTEESGAYSNWGHSVVGVFSTYEAALAAIPEPFPLAREEWDGCIEDEHRYGSGPRREPRADDEGVIYEIAPYELNEVPVARDYDEGVHDRPLPPPRFAAGDRVRSVRSKRLATVVRVRDWRVGDRYGREITILPDDLGFIGRGVGNDGKAKIDSEDELELVERAVRPEARA